MHRDIADRFGLESRKDVYVRKMPLDEVPGIASVVFGFRDQYIGRVPMRLIRMGMKGTSAYAGKVIDLPNACIRAKVHALYDSDRNVPVRCPLTLV